MRILKDMANGVVNDQGSALKNSSSYGKGDRYTAAPNE